MQSQKSSKQRDAWVPVPNNHQMGLRAFQLPRLHQIGIGYHRVNMVLGGPWGSQAVGCPPLAPHVETQLGMVKPKDNNLRVSPLTNDSNPSGRQR